MGKLVDDVRELMSDAVMVEAMAIDDLSRTGTEDAFGLVFGAMKGLGAAIIRLATEIEQISAP